MPVAVKKPTVIVAWTEEEMVHDGKPYALDRGERPKMVSRDVGKSVVWKHNASASDFDKALVWAMREHKDLGRVYIYDASERDPLAQARTDVLAKKPSAKGL